jgi:putative ABC transport system ATP-binding protein
MIRTEALVKKYQSGEKDLLALKGINLTVKSGEFVSIIGRSGSGKSTLLYQLGLLDRPTSGKIWIDDRDIDSLSEEERTLTRLCDLGYVFQDYALLPELTAIENVAVPLLMQGLNQTAAKKKAKETLEWVELGNRINHLPSRLSGGEQQRVSIARAIAHNPKILFADEPTANLDNDTSLVIIKLFQKLHATGQTIIMVTHEAEYAKLTNRVITLFDGQIVKEEKHHP